MKKKRIKKLCKANNVGFFPDTITTLYEQCLGMIYLKHNLRRRISKRLCNRHSLLMYNTLMNVSIMPSLFLKSISSHGMPSSRNNAFSFVNTWSFIKFWRRSLTKLMHNCSKLLTWRFSNPAISRIPIDAVTLFL